MARRRKLFASSAMALALAQVIALGACGGGGGGSSPPIGSVPTPTPTPAPTPPPPPSAASRIALTQLADFPTLGWIHRYELNGNANDADPRVTLPLDPAERVAFGFNATDQKHEIGIPGLEPSRLLSTTFDFDDMFSISTLDPASGTSLVLLSPGSNNNLIPLNHTSFGYWGPNGPVPPGRSVRNAGVFAYGVPTAAGDVPIVAARRYHGAGQGLRTAGADLRLGQEGGRLWADAALLDFDFQAGSLSGTLVLYNGERSAQIAQYSFLENVHAAGGTTFSGTLSNPEVTGTGFYEGRFTGPEVREFMMRWQVPFRDPATGQVETVYGVLVALRY
jgi:hypothetical protein